jgi:DNA-binding NarL/FixJ family response regulator
VSESAVTVELAIGDPELAARVRDVLVEGGGGFCIVAAGDAPQVLVTDALDEYANRWPEGSRVLALARDIEVADALHLGATGALSADAGAALLRAAVRATALGLTTLPAALRDQIVDRPSRQEVEGDEDAPTIALTPRELQVLRLMTEGASNKAIARQLGITPHTVKFHVAAIVAKLGASGRTDAVVRGMRLGLVMV